MPIRGCEGERKSGAGAGGGERGGREERRGPKGRRECVCEREKQGEEETEKQGDKMRGEGERNRRVRGEGKTGVLFFTGLVMKSRLLVFLCFGAIEAF